jgi:outer membrane protein assembly factor BamE (lipoprotein component of BamABCDE complex)
MLTSCSMGGKTFTAEQFYTVPFGASPNEVVQTAGKPYAKKQVASDKWEYTYVERYDVGGRKKREVKYIFVFKDGKVVQKKTFSDSTSPLDINSYDLQTSQNEDET